MGMESQKILPILCQLLDLYMLDFYDESMMRYSPLPTAKRGNTNFKFVSVQSQ